MDALREDCVKFGRISKDILDAPLYSAADRDVIPHARPSGLMAYHPLSKSAWISAVLLGLVWAAPVPADEALIIEELGVRRGQVTAGLRLVEAFDSETRRSIERGLPITVRFTTEIWRNRRRWFDKQLDSRVRSYRVRYDPGEKHFVVASSGRFRHREAFETLDAVIEHLSYRLLPIYPRWNLEDRHTYYLAVEAAIQPLTLDEFRELDGWISGKIRGGASEGERQEEEADGEGGFSGAFFDLLVNLSGFGDKIFRIRTPDFRPESLSDLPIR
jgi:hypothetical protein